jgi:hypothetical protein
MCSRILRPGSSVAKGSLFLGIKVVSKKKKETWPPFLWAWPAAEMIDVDSSCSRSTSNWEIFSCSCIRGKDWWSKKTKRENKIEKMMHFGLVILTNLHNQKEQIIFFFIFWYWQLMLAFSHTFSLPANSIPSVQSRRWRGQGGRRRSRKFNKLEHKYIFAFGQTAKLLPKA